MSKSILCRTICIILLTCSHTASAEDNDSAGWSYSVQIGTEVEPAYTGSDVYAAEPDLNIEASYQSMKGHRYYLSLGELGADWAIATNTLLRTNLEYEFGRNNADDPALTGFPEVDDTIEAQSLLFRRVGPFMLGAGLQIDILDRGKGLVGFLGARYQKAFTSTLSLTTGLDLSFANAEHMFTEVGISRTTAETTRNAPYTPESGYKGVSVQLGLAYRFQADWMLKADVAIERYGAEMRNSPLIAEHGTDSTYEAAITLVRDF